MYVLLPTVRKGKATTLGLDLESGQEKQNENENFLKEKEEKTLGENIVKEEMGSEISDTEVRFISELKVGVLGSCRQGFTHSSLSTDI